LALPKLHLVLSERPSLITKNYLNHS